jgi:DNA-binding response OmpR family regulator
MAAKHVLAIEHDWRMRKLIQANLEALGLEVQGAVSGQHSLHLLRLSKPDLILLDTDLPDMEASQLLGDLRAGLAGQSVPIIVLCTDPPSRQTAEARQIDGISHLIKPFDALALLQHVKQALAAGVVPPVRSLDE